jgi:hypothetical protein
VLVIGWVLLRIHDYGLLGYDSYPILVESRIQSLGDFFRIFHDSLMNGRYPGEFYRPVLNLSFALDSAIWGLNPFGYQLGNAVLFGTCSVAILFLARRLSGDYAVVAPWAAFIAFLLHPSHAEILPVAPRRPETLACLFFVGALIAQRTPGLTWRRSWMFALTVLALGSKETALFAPGVGFAIAWLYPSADLAPSGSAAPFTLRLRTAARETLPYLAAAFVMLGLRFLVLGGLGGHAASSLQGIFEELPTAITVFSHLLVAPQPVMQTTPLPLFLCAAALLACLTVSTVLRNEAREAGHSERRIPSATMMLTSLIWIVGVYFAYAAANKIRPWYLLFPVAGWALWVGAAAELALRGWSSGKQTARAAGVLAALALLSLIVWQSFYSPLLRTYPEWERATQAERSFTTQLAKQIEAAEDGTTISAPPLPSWSPPEPSQPTVYGAAILNDYSVQAWVELMYPNRRISVIKPRSRANPKAKANELVVLLSSNHEDFSIPRGERLLNPIWRTEP